MTRAPDHAVPFFDIADPAFSVTSAQVRQAREADWYPRTSYGWRCSGTTRCPG